jgi:ribosomal protein L16 Arg81 hydroxylase
MASPLLRHSWRNDQLPSTTFSLDWLLQPVSKSVFFSDYWEKRPLVIKRANPAYFDKLLTLNDVDHVITALDRGFPNITLKDAKRALSASDYTVDGKALDVTRVYQLFQEGATITLAYLDTVLPTLALFCRSLETEFSCPFQTNIYLTPAKAQGAKPHYDTHDVFVLQVSGSKKWQIYGTPVELPLPGQDFDAASHQLGELTQEFELQPGDVAYIPRGVAHDAHSTDLTSLHITAGILRYTWADLLLECVASASLNDPAFRRALPPGLARADFNRVEARQTLQRLLQQVSEKADFDAAIEELVDQFLSSCPPVLTGQISQIARLDELTAQSLAGARQGIIYRLQTSDDCVTVDHYSGTVTFPRHVYEPLRFALEHSRFVVGELPGDLDDEGKLVLVRRLIREGLVEAHD